MPGELVMMKRMLEELEHLFGQELALSVFNQIDAETLTLMARAVNDLPNDRRSAGPDLDGPRRPPIPGDFERLRRLIGPRPAAQLVMFLNAEEQAALFLKLPEVPIDPDEVMRRLGHAVANG